MNINTQIVNEFDKCGIVNNKTLLCNSNTFCSNNICKRTVDSKNDIDKRLCSDQTPLNRTWTLDGIHHINNVGWVSNSHNCYQDKIQCESKLFNDRISFNTSEIKPTIKCWINRHDEAGNKHRHYIN